jgi:dihydroorotate dehydrogenase (fumarate)
VFPALNLKGEYMADLKTTYMGIDLDNPIIAGASSLTSNMDRLKELEEAGVGAVVIASLFEEQIQMESFKLQEQMQAHNDLYAEMTTLFPEVEHAGAEPHLMWVRRAKETLNVPVIASLNAVTPETWVEYAKQLAETGVDGLELNFYATPSDSHQTAADIEDEQVETLKEVVAALSVPVSVKLSYFYTNPLNVVKRMDDSGVGAFVLFNRFFQPDMDVEKEANLFPHNTSSSVDNRIPLRYVGLLAGDIKADIAANTGILDSQDAIKMILAGATGVQLVSTLFRNRASYVATVGKEIEEWMDRKGYASLSDFRGKLSYRNNPDPWVYRRAQYVRLLLRADVLKGGPTA